MTNVFDLLDSVSVPQVARQALSDWIEAQHLRPDCFTGSHECFPAAGSGEGCFGTASRTNAHCWRSARFFLLHRARCGVLANPKPEQFHLDAEQSETVDFLRSHEAYKYFWGGQDQPSYRRAFFREEKN
jgi:hypothetical protein